MITRAVAGEVARSDPLPEHERVVAGAAVARTGVVDDVRPVATVKEVGVGATGRLDTVVAGAAGEGVDEGVITVVDVVGHDQVITRAAIDGVIGVVAEGNGVIAVAAAQHVGVRTLVDDHVIAGAAVDGVAAVAVGDNVVAC